MAYASYSAPQPGFGSNPIVEAFKSRRQQDLEAKLRREQMGTDLQKARMNADVELEKVRTNVKKDIAIAKFNAGMGQQLKQMGIDADITIQKLRNLNAYEVTELKGKIDQMIERTKNQNVQAQIVKQYQANLELANYNAKQALERTFLDVYGDIFRHGDPASNAVDAAAFAMWSIALTAAMNHLSFDQYQDKTKNPNPEGLDTLKELKVEEPKTTDEIVNKVLQNFKGSGQQNKGRERYAKPSFRTKIQMVENKRSGSAAWKR